MTGLNGKPKVFLDAQGRKEVRDLERAPDARLGDRFRRETGNGLALEKNVAFVRRVEPRNQVEGRGFSRAVGTDQGMKGAVAHGDVDALHGLERAETLGDAARLEDDAVHMIRRSQEGRQGLVRERAPGHGGLFGHLPAERRDDRAAPRRPGPWARA